MTENAVQLGYIWKGVIYSQTLPYVLPCVSVWHVHLPVWSSLCHYSYRAILYIVGIAEVLSLPEMLIFMCKCKYSYVNTSTHFFLPRLLATEDKLSRPQRKEEENLGGNKVFKAFPFLEAVPDWAAISSSRAELCARLDLSRSPLTATINSDCLIAAILKRGQGRQYWSFAFTASSSGTSHPTWHLSSSFTE